MNRRPALALMCLLTPLAHAAELPFLNSETEYSATRIIETSEGNFEQKVNWTPDKVRTETNIEGVVLLNIVRDDLGLMWISNPAMGRCLEQPVEDADSTTQLGGQYEANDVAYEELGEETLEGRKVTSTGGGKDARTRSEVFHTITVAETGRASRIVDGKAELVLPQEAPPSHEQARRALQWVLVVKGTIRGWPDLREEYLLWVHPREGAG